VNHARVSQSGIAWVGNFPSGVNVNAPVIVLTDGVILAIESDVMPLHGVSFGLKNVNVKVFDSAPYAN
jgi:hypothetical protein